MKKTGKKLISVLTALLLVAALAGCTTAPAVDAGEKDRLPRVGIVQLAEHAALDSACEGFIAALAENGFVDGETVEIDLQNAQGDQSNLSTIGERFLGEKVDLILAIATPAAQAMAGKTRRSRSLRPPLRIMRAQSSSTAMRRLAAMFPARRI